MTMKERLAVHFEIESDNVEHVKRFKLMQLHSALVRKGQLAEARVVLRLLRFGYLCMGLGDLDWKVQNALESIGHPVWFSRSGYTAWARCERGRTA